MKEMLDVVNDQDEVIGKVAYEEVYKSLLTHRIVHILIFNTSGKLALQLRSKKKSKYANMWSTSVGGHVQAGETYEEAALREFEEELGTTTDITLAYKDWYRDLQGHNKMLTTFTGEYNGPYMINHDEVEKIEYFSLDEIKKMIKKGEPFHPELLYILHKHYDFI